MLVYLRDRSTETIVRTTETDVADKSWYLTQSQHIDTGPASPSSDPITPGGLWGTSFEVTCMNGP